MRDGKQPSKTTGTDRDARSKTAGTDRDVRSRVRTHEEASSTDTPPSTDTVGLAPRTVDRTRAAPPSKRRRTRGEVSESGPSSSSDTVGPSSSFDSSWGLLLGVPGEVAALTIKYLEPRDFAALCMCSRALHVLVEQALRLRSVEQGYALPLVLPAGEARCHERVQLILSLERRRAQLGRTISAGMSHSLFISPEGNLLSCGTEWDHAGNPAPGLVGHGELVETGDTPAQIIAPTRLPSLHGVRITAVTAGVTFSLALSAEGQVFSWGQGDMRQLGHGWTPEAHHASFEHTPRRITALQGERVIAVEAGFIHALALSDAGVVFSWGAGGDGRLGHGHARHVSAPKRIAYLKEQRVRSIAAGYESSLALTHDGTVFSWGRGALGQLGHGGNPKPSSENRPRKVEVLGAVPISAIAAGNKRSLALSRGGAVYSWGDGSDGQLGHGDDLNLDTPRQVAALAHLEVATVVAGASHSFAITTDGALFSWGAGQCGRLGHGDEESQKAPLRVAGLQAVKVRAVSGGAFHSLAADEHGGLHGWGDGDGASLGLNLTQDQLVPTRYDAGLRVALE